MIKINYDKDKLLDSFAIETLKERYMLPDEKSPQEAFARAATAFSDGDNALAQRIYDAVSNLWFMFATPVLSNAPDSNGKTAGLPISCNLQYVGDSRRGLNEHWNEVTWLSSNGAGLGAYWGNVRSDGTATSRGSKSTGIIPFMHVVDSQMLAVRQGTVRRGAYAAYLDISHPEIDEFLDMRKPNGGDIHRRNLNLHHGVNIPDKFMELLDKPDAEWELVDPHSKQVTKKVNALQLWYKILTLRYETGEPYLHFIDTTNRLANDAHKKLGIKIHQSNLCTEITLPTGPDDKGNHRTAVCCLSSLNLEKYDEWKDTTLVADLVTFLDNVLEYYITHAGEDLKNARYSAGMERSIGIGTMGFHAYLQLHNIPFESGLAVSRNRSIFKSIREKAEKRTWELGKERGNAPDFTRAFPNPNSGVIKSMYPTEYRRNIYLLAIAPNASTSILCGNTSPSVEPFKANAFTQKTLNGTNVLKNKYLDKILRGYYAPEYDMTGTGYKGDKKSYEEDWKAITSDAGSCQNVAVLTSDEKEVFKTAIEIDQRWIVEHAAMRQEFIDQAQSINLFFPKKCNKKYLHEVHYLAWKKGLKTLYYCRTEASKRAENINERFEKHDYKFDDTTCFSCEG